MDELETFRQLLSMAAEARVYAALVSSQKLAQKDAEIARLKQALALNDQAVKAIEADKPAEPAAAP